MLDENSKSISEENFNFFDSFNESKVFSHGYFDQLNKYIQEMAISNANNNNYQITDSTNELHK